MNRASWDEYFIGLCLKIAERSKDRSSKVASMIVGPDKEIRSTGYNGMPRGVNDEIESRHERPKKYFYFEHSERNAVFNAARIGVSCKGCTMYVASIPPLPICADCARAIIQAGITEVIVGALEAPERWRESVEAGREMLEEAGVKVRLVQVAPKAQVPMKTLQERVDNETYNIVSSYTVTEDHELDRRGFKFLGAGQDEHGVEVHFFQKIELSKFQESKDA